MDRTILIILCVAVACSGCVAQAVNGGNIRYQDPSNPDYSITFYSSSEYSEYDGTFEINENGNMVSGKYTENPNSYGLYMANGLGCTIEKTENGIKTLEGYEWVRK